MEKFNDADPRFQQFLAKQRTEYTKELIPFIQKNCEPYLKAIKRSKRNLYLLGNGFSTIPSNTKTALLVWQKMNFGFSMPSYFTVLNKTKLGKILDRIGTTVSYSTSKSLTEADIYVFPIGEFKYFWSPLVPSINLLFKNIIFQKEEKANFLNVIHNSRELKTILISHQQDIDVINNSIDATEIQQAVDNLLGELHYTNTSFYKGYNSGNEIVIDAVGFYMAKAAELDTKLLRATFF